MKNNKEFHPCWTIYASTFNLLLQTAQHCGLDRKELLLELGLDKAKVDDPDNRISVANYYKLYQLIERKSSNPDIGLITGKIAFANGQNLQIYMTTICRTFRDYLNFVPSVVNFSGDIGIAKVKGVGDLLRIEWHPLVPATNNDRYLADAFLTSAAAMISSICIKQINVIKTEFSYKQPSNIEALINTFGENISFEKDVNCIYFKRASLELALCQLEYNLSQRFIDQIQQIFTLQSCDQFSLNLRNSILKLLPIGNLNINNVAGALNISKRTLQRRLAEKNSRFSQVVQDVRVALSKNYIVDKRLNFTEIAFLLGYSDQSTFTSAFKQWYGCTPGKYRENLGEKVSSNRIPQTLT